MLPVTLCSTTIAVWQTGSTACPAELLVKSGCPLAPTDEKMLVCQCWQQGVIKTFPVFLVFFFSGNCKRMLWWREYLLESQNLVKKK